MGTQFYRSGWASNRTMARMSDIKRLTVQKVVVEGSESKDEMRCSGMCVYHTDGSIDTLGQWEGSLMRTSDCIYDASLDGSLFGIEFRMARGKIRESKPNTQYYMANIHIEASASKDGGGHRDDSHEFTSPEYQSFYWKASEEHEYISWWFNQFHDYVEYWDLGKIDITIEASHHIESITLQ
ncbi:hypothetical protein PT974_05272 [Cladobotryum mycophilum]|uniref:Uncharacterized protein n=1 Tax=Cladobotryum mycophilum TaxID=491253 RepID=A0ABR0SIA9_9HYPO